MAPGVTEMYRLTGQRNQKARRRARGTMRRCPRCGGNIYYGADLYGSYRGCLQCGCYHYLEQDILAESGRFIHERVMLNQLCRGVDRCQ